MITDEVYVEIELLKKHGLSLRKIAKEVGCAVNTVRRHLDDENPPRYDRKKTRAPKLSPFEGYLRERQAAAHPAWIPASVLLREIVALGYTGGGSQLRAFLRSLKPSLPLDPVVRFETVPGEQMQVDWVEFRKGKNPLYAFCATLGFSRMSFVEFVTDMRVQTLIACHHHAFEYFGGVTRRVLYDNMKTVVIERDASGEGEHASTPGFSIMHVTAVSSSSCAGRIKPGPRARLSALMAICDARFTCHWQNACKRYPVPGVAISRQPAPSARRLPDL